MSEEHQSSNKETVRRYVEAFNQGDFEAMPGLFTEDALVYGVLGWGGMDVALPVWRQLHEAFNLQLAIEGIAEASDTVVVRYTERGTFRAPFREHPPTGKSYELVAMEWFELKGGRIHRRWGARDSASMARQLEMKLQ